MKNIQIKIISIIIITIIFMICFSFNKIQANNVIDTNQISNNITNNEKVDITYRTHVQNIGWQGFKQEEQISGTSNQALRLEAIQINNTNTDFKIKYKVHVQNIGWQDWKEQGEISGTSNQALRLEAIQIRLEDNENYTVQYRTHVQNVGWQEWKKDGEISGTQGQALRLEAIQIRIVDKQLGVTYESHVQNIGWQEEWGQNGTTSGTEGQSLRLESIKIKLINAPENAQISYDTYAQGKGWQGWKKDGEVSGTQGQALRIESIKIKLVNLDNYDVKYRAHIENVGWISWKENGVQAGVPGSKLKIEAIEIIVQEKTREILYGIDVARYQGTIDWAKVKQDNIDFAIIRAGYRGWGSAGSLNQDDNFSYNATNAVRNGVKIGVYFFSQATNIQEALEEANYTLGIIRGYNITYPVVIDVEYANSSHTGRADNVSKEMRTKICQTFCDRIIEAGYTPMIYADKWFSSNNLDMTQLQNYDFWLAHYTGATRDNPTAKPSNYSGKYQIWQYSSTGTVDGISTDVDMNIGYKNYK